MLFRHGGREVHRHLGDAFVVGGYDLLTPALNGWTGVDLFFVLSGFLVTWHVLRRWRRPLAPVVSRYLARRALRILPAYYVTLAIVAFGLVPGYPVSGEDWGWRFAYHLLFLQDYLPADFVVAFWSLGVEEKFYLLAPWILVALGALPSRWLQGGVLLALFAAPAVLRAITWASLDGPVDYPMWFAHLRSPFHACADGLFLGALVAVAMLAFGRRLLGPWPLFLGLAGFLAILLPVNLVDHISWFDAVPLQSLIAVCSAGMLAGALSPSDNPVHRFLRSRVLSWFSRLAYTLYLVHMVFLVSGWALATRVPGWETLGPVGQVLVYAAIFGSMSLVTALALHFAVEKPFLLLKDRVGSSNSSTGKTTTPPDRV